MRSSLGLHCISDRVSESFASFLSGSVHFEALSKSLLLLMECAMINDLDICLLSVAGEVGVRLKGVA